MGTEYIGDGFYYTDKMREEARRIEVMTNPFFYPGSGAGMPYIHCANFNSGLRKDIDWNNLERGKE